VWCLSLNYEAPLRCGQSHAPAAKGHAQIANLVDHARIGNAPLVYRCRVDGKPVGSVDGHELDLISLAIGDGSLAIPSSLIQLLALVGVVFVIVIVGAVGLDGTLLATKLQKLVLSPIVRMRHVLASATSVIVCNRIGTVEERPRRRHRCRRIVCVLVESPRGGGDGREPCGRSGRLGRLLLTLCSHMACPALLV